MRRGFSLIELLVVLLIMGVVSSIAIFALRKSNIATPPTTLSTLKNNLFSLSNGTPSTLICTAACQHCFIRTENSSDTIPISLKKEGEITRYGFDRYGELRPMGNAVIPTEKGYKEVCFTLKYSPEGFFSPLILKNNQTFYAYTPLGNMEPLITQSEEKVRALFYDEAIIPTQNGNYYGAP